MNAEMGSASARKSSRIERAVLADFGIMGNRLLPSRMARTKLRIRSESPGLITQNIT